MIQVHVQGQLLVLAVMQAAVVSQEVYASTPCIVPALHYYGVLTRGHVHYIYTVH